MSQPDLWALVEDATVDCYGRDEQVNGLYAMIRECLATPFQSQVLGVAVVVEDLDLTEDGRIVAVCSRGAARQAICISDLPLPTPRPPGAEWIDAYSLWAGSQS